MSNQKISNLISLVNSISLLLFEDYKHRLQKEDPSKFADSESKCEKYISSIYGLDAKSNFD